MHCSKPDTSIHLIQQLNTLNKVHLAFITFTLIGLRLWCLGGTSLNNYIHTIPYSPFYLPVSPLHSTTTRALVPEQFPTNYR